MTQIKTSTLLYALVILASHAFGQSGVRPGPNYSDTLVFSHWYNRFKIEVDKRGELDLDTLLFYGLSAIRLAKEIDYKAGLIRVYLGLGSGYISKTEVDSSKHYYLASIQHAAALHDKRLLALSYAGLGYTLVYDQSDYEGAINNLQKAAVLAEIAKDTTLYIYATKRLVKVYYLASMLLESFKLCSRLHDLCEIRKDTIELINNYHMFGSIYGRMNMYEKQMDMVYKGLELYRNKEDTFYLYTVNLTASNGYLFRQQYDSVLYYSRLNLAYCQHLNYMPNCYSNMAKAFLATNQLDSARYYYRLIMDFHKKNGTYVDTYLYLDLGKIEYLAGFKHKALEYYKMAEANISKPTLSTQTDIYKALFEYYDECGAVEATLYYLKKYKIWSDSLANHEFAKTILANDLSILKEQNRLLYAEKEYQTIVAEKQRNEKYVAFGGTVFAILLTLFGYHWNRKQKNLKHKQILLNERLRISRELHDEVGSTLSGIAMYSHVASTQLHNAEKNAAEQSLSFIQNSAGEMVTKLSDIVWLINPEQDTVMEMFGRLDEYGKQMTRVREMQMKIDLPADLASKHIPLEDRRNIYLFCKEAINNAVKYSNGKTLMLQVKSAGQQMIFSVTDDGNGFDESIIRQGNGLVNMQKRAQDIGAEFHIDTKANHGTRLELHY